MGYFSQGKDGRDNKASGETGSEAMARVAAAAKKAAESVSTLGPGMVITGNIVCEGAAQIFGRVTGDIQAVQISIGEGAQVEGNVTAHDITINGSFKGTIRGNNVKLKGAAAIDGEVFSKSLTVEENVQFEGISRRLDKPIELPSLPQVSTGKPALVAKPETGAISESAA